MRGVLTILILGAATAALAGCGSNSAKTTPTTTIAAPTQSSAATTTPASPLPITAPAVKLATGAAALRYDRQMQALGAKLSSYFSRVGQLDATATQQQAIANIKQVQAHLRAANVQLEAMKLPPGAQAGHAALIAAVREYANELDEVVAALKKGHRAALSAMGQLKGIRDMGKATQTIAAEGFDITGGSTASP